MIPIVVLASGRGSNFEAIHHAIQKKILDAKILAVISDKPNAIVLEKAKEYGIEALSIPFPSAQKGGHSLEIRRKEHEFQVLEKLEKIKPHFLVMAGYMRIVTSQLIEAFRSERGYSRMVNIHPSLLPAFPGVNAYAQAYQYGTQCAGVTVHLVEATVDSGPICAQESFSIAGCKSVSEVEQRGLMVEHRLFPQTLSWVLPENFRVEKRAEGRICVSPN
jgi:phosphoribosylglycinamide formyltransferase 1